MDDGDTVTFRSESIMPSESRTSARSVPLSGWFPSFTRVNVCFAEPPRGMNSNGADDASVEMPAKSLDGTSTLRINSLVTKRPLLLALTYSGRSKPVPASL